MPPRKDALIALALLLLGLTALIEGPHRLVVGVLTVGWSVPLAWRRVHPLALLLAAYTGGRELDVPAAWLALALVLGSLWIGLAYVRAEFIEFAFSGLGFGGAWAIGQAIRRRDREVHAAREREREAVRDERTRIARELHDVVSHSISVVAIQTQAVRRRLRPDQAQEAEDLRAVEAVTREALAEMRRLFGVLRADGEAGALAPQPGLDQLPALIEQAGVPVELSVRGEPRPLPPGLDLAAYRIVQEALTNARRHARPSRVELTLTYGDPDLEISVCDDGRGAGGNGTPGHGLVGMRERVALYGGELEAGDREEGGYRVVARLPMRR